MPPPGKRPDSEASQPRPTPTAIDAADAFDATDPLADLTVESGLPIPLRGTIAESDPPTAIVNGHTHFVDLPPGSVVGDTYEVVARIGAGAMGEVYAARHLRLGKRVAIKVIGRNVFDDVTAIERFALEAKTLARIQHPAIVAVDHVGELADGRAFFVMELLRGETLFDRLQRGRVSLRDALRVLDQMARGLEAAHAEGVVHRDLKPENTFLVHLPGEPAAVKLVDFGLIKLRTPDPTTERTQSGVAIGTPLYMSPEQMRGKDVDHRTDVYALGCVAYELLLGVVPFPHARAVPELYAAHLHEPPPLPRTIWPEIPPQLDLVVFAMLAKDPAHRPTLAQVRACLAAVQVSSSTRAPTELVAPEPRGRLARSAVAAIGAATLLVGILIGVALTRARAHAPITVPVAPVAPVAPVVVAPVPSATTTVTAPAIVVKSAPIATPSPAPHPRSRTSRDTRGGSAGSDAASAGETGSDVRPVQKITTVDEGSTAVPIGRNQTINPFAPKRPQ